MRDKGKLLVIEGGDSSGKEVQSKKLFEKLRQLKYPVKFVDFPRYERFAGKLVGRYLKGEFGEVFDVNGHLSALPFALDRFGFKEDILRWLAEGYIIICNRYVSSNLAYMSAKFAKKERAKFISWLEELEYKILGVPHESLTIFLKVPANIGQKLTYKKDEKVYMKGLGRGDIHERNLRYLVEVGKQYDWLARNRNHWAVVDSMAGPNNLRPIEEIHEDILKILYRRRIITLKRER